MKQGSRQYRHLMRAGRHEHPEVEMPNEDEAICSICQGDCCRTKPGVESPDPFMATAAPAQALASLLTSGEWVLDRHYGLPPGENGEPQVMAADLEILYPRPATVSEATSGTIFATAGTDACFFLTDRGCRLTFETRPRMCRALQPHPDFNCTSTWTRLEAARAWLPWQDVVQASILLVTAPPSGAEPSVR